MRIAAVFVAGLLGAASLVGCGSEKQLPDAVTVPPDDPKDAGPTIPKASEDEAKKVVDRYLKAVAGGDAARLAKLKTFKLSLSGSMQLPTAEGNVVRMESARNVELAWPDRARVEDVLQSKLIPPVHSGLRWPSIWIAQQQPDGGWAARPTTRSQERLFLAEFAANVAFPFANPLNDPRTVVYQSRTVTSGNGAADLIQASIPDCPPFTLWFDSKSGYLGRVDFAVDEGGQVVRGSVALDDYKSFDGLMLPGKVAYVRGGVNAEEWKVEKLEFVPSIDAARFDPPRDEKK